MSDTNEVDVSDYEDIAKARLKEQQTPSIGHNSQVFTLADLTILAQEQLECESDVARAQAVLTRAQERLKDVAERRLPEAMEAIGMSDFTTSTGLYIDIDETIRASPPKLKRPEAFAFLRANGAVALLKRKVIVEFGKGDDTKAAELTKELVEKFPENTTDETSVHPSTLTAWVKKRIEAGKDIPMEVFGVFRQKIAKITRPKE